MTFDRQMVFIVDSSRIEVCIHEEAIEVENHFQVKESAADNVRKIYLNQHHLCYFFTKSYVLPLARIVSSRRF